MAVELERLRQNWDQEKSPHNMLALAQGLSESGRASEIESYLNTTLEEGIEVPPEVVLLLPQWARVRQLLNTWYKAPVCPADGWTLAQLSAFEKAREHPYWKGGMHRFPSTMWQFFYTLGHRFEYALLFYEAEMYATSWPELGDLEPTSLEIRTPDDVGSLSHEELEDYLEGETDAFDGGAEDYLISAEGAWNGSVAFLQLLSELKPGEGDPRSWLVSLEEVGGARTALPFSTAIARLIEMDLHCLTEAVLEEAQGRGCLGALASGVRHIAFPDAEEVLGASQTEVSAFDPTALREALAPLELDAETLSKVVFQGASILVADETTAQTVEAHLMRLRAKPRS